MTDQTATVTPRKVGFLLGVGIVFLPIVFAWFLLRRGHSTLSRVVGFGWLILVVLVWVGGSFAPATSPSSDPTPAAQPLAGTPKGATPASPAAPATRWRYDESADQMRGTTAKYASVISDNELDFEFPYGRGNSTTLTVRKDGGVDVYLTIEKGQFLCNGFTDDSYVSVKFDDGPIQRFNCSSASDGRSDTAFLRNSARFVTALKSADKVTVEAEFFQSGRRQIIFSTSGLVWD